MSFDVLYGVGSAQSFKAYLNAHSKQVYNVTWELNVKKLRIFAASPSDMAAERDMVNLVAETLKPLADSLNITLEVVDWGSVVPNMGRPEQVILDQLEPTSWDVFIGILWHRFGSPTGSKASKTGQEYLSGTEEEFRIAYEIWKERGRPRIIMYRCERRIPPKSLDAVQFQRVNDFFNEFGAQKGAHPGLFQTFDTTRSFEKLLLHNLQKLLIEYGGDFPKQKVSEKKNAGSARVFVCYKRAAEADRRFAEYLSIYLTAEGHTVFIDKSMRIGTEWLRKIDEQISISDYLIVLVSQDSADSEMVQAEVLRAYHYRNKTGAPKTLPVRMNFEGLLPYTIAAFLGSYQHASWRSTDDNEQVAQEILEVIGGRVQPQIAITKSPDLPVSFSEDGRPLYSEGQITRPLSEFDPRLLDELGEPGGSIRLGDRFYIERASDEKLRRTIIKNGQTITVRASRQTGKSSLLVRGINHARSQANVVYVDLQSVEHTQFETPDRFLKYLASTITRKLHMEDTVLDQIWNERLGSQDKLVKVMEDFILPSTDKQIILAIDEADKLLTVPFHDDFFALLRSWHNNRAIDPQWNKLNLVLIIATEPYLLISDPNQSPFNVGLKLNLEDFDREQVQDLNHRHGNPVTEKDREAFFQLFNGHPYLTRKAFFLMVTENWKWDDLRSHAIADQGPFADHLRRQLWFIREDDVLRDTLQQILRTNKCDDDKALWRLLRAGLVKGSGNSYYYRCGLYEEYFREHLK